MAQVRVATLNVENLLQRFNFHAFGQLTVEPALRLLGIEPEDEDYQRLRQSLHVTLSDDSRQQTSQLIRDTQADLVCLQEVEHKKVLDDFHERYLKKSANVHYGWRRLLEGNDIRGIDVGVMAKKRIEVKSHKDVTFDDFGLFNQALEDYGASPGDPIFRRDCLRVVTDVGGTDLHVYVCHFKSMAGDRADSKPMREAEAAAVKRIIEGDFQDPAAGAWLVMGDLNDYTELGGAPDAGHGLGPLVGGGFCVDLVKRRPADDRWTHYWAGGDQKSQIDYILASPAIAAANPNATPDILRRGQPFRVPGLEAAPRYPRVGFDRPKASDHCAVAVTLDL